MLKNDTAYRGDFMYNEIAPIFFFERIAGWSRDERVSGQ